MALAPDLLVIEHPTASLGRGRTCSRSRAILRRLAERRALTAVAVTADAPLASAITSDVRRLSRRPGNSSRRRAHGNACGASSADYFFSITPHATRGPPLTPDLARPWCPDPDCRER